MSKPEPRTLTFYLWHEFEGYVRAERPTASWMLHRDHWGWENDENGNNLKQWSEAAAHLGAYTDAERADIAWMREQFGDEITVRR